MILTTPSPNSPERWWLLATLLLLLGMAAYIAWPRPDRVVYPDGTPVVVGKKGEQRLREQFARDTTQAATHLRRADSTRQATTPILHKAQQTHYATHHLRPRHLPTAPDSVVLLADSLQRVLANY